MYNGIHQDQSHIEIPNAPHVLGLLDFGKISQEIRAIKASKKYKVIAIFQNREPESKKLTGKQITTNGNKYFDFGHAALLVEEGENGGHDTIRFIYTGAMKQSDIQSKVDKLLSEDTLH